MSKASKKVLALLCAASVVVALPLSACNPGVNGGNGDGDTKYTVLDRAIELINNVDELPSSSDLMGTNGVEENTQSLKAVSQALYNSAGTDEGVTDWSTPDEEYYNRNRYTDKYGFEVYDDYIGYFKEWKDGIVDGVRQMGIWIKTGAGYSYRLNYDRKKDLVCAEFLSDTTYMVIKSTYNSEVKMVIDAVYTLITDELRHATTLYYVEDDILTYTYKFDHYTSYGVNKTVIEKDYKNDKFTQLFMSHSRPDNPTPFYWPNASMFVDYEGVSAVFGVAPPGGTDRGVFLYDSNGRRLADMQGDIQLPLYQLEGWDRVYSTESPFSVVMQIGDTEYSSLEQYDYDGLFKWTPGFMGDYFTREPAIYILMGNENVNYSNKLPEFLASLGLSVKGEQLSTVIKAFSDYERVTSEWSALGYSDFSDFDKDYFFDIYDGLTSAIVTPEQLEALNKEPYVIAEEQTEENEVFALLDITVDGTVSLDGQTGELDLSGITANIPRSILFTEGAEYSLVIALKGSYDLIELGEVSAAFEGKEFSLSGFGKATVKNKVGDDDYRLVAYIIKKSSDQRLSEFYNLVADKEEVYAERWEEQNEGRKLSYTFEIAVSTDGVTVSKYYLVSIGKK